MRLLLDTHALIWAGETTLIDRLGSAAAAAISDPQNDVMVSAASAWEVATKYRLGRLREASRAIRVWPEILSGLGAEELAVTARHGLRAGSFDVAHRDPFDRLLAAQAELEYLTLVTADRAMDQFGVDILW